MDFRETLDYLYAKLPIFQRQGKAALKPNLDNTLSMLDYLGNPHQTFKSVHVAGTNGKGTSCHAIASILQEAGYQTGLYTSPHLKSFTERIRVNGEEIEEDWVVNFVEGLRDIIESVHPSFFEVTVVMAFQYFKERKVDVAIIETGLGGRLDSTNVITPEVSLITNIGYDHQDLLGESLGEIASEKAGIIKQEIPVVLGKYQTEIFEVFNLKANELRAPLNVKSKDYKVRSSGFSNFYREFEVFDGDKEEKYTTDILADYFLDNVPGIIETVQTLKKRNYVIRNEDLKKGFSRVWKNTGLKGRFQLLRDQPLMIADISHNEEGIRALLRQIDEINFEQLHIIYGTVADKKVESIVSVFPKDSCFYLTQSSVPRSMKVGDLKQLSEKMGLDGEPYKNVNDAIDTALNKASSHDLILITGSTFVVAEIEIL